MEIEGRVVAATLDFMQITSLDDTPPENVLPLSFVDATAETLKDLAFQICGHLCCQPDKHKCPHGRAAEEAQS